MIFSFNFYICVSILLIVKVLDAYRTCISLLNYETKKAKWMSKKSNPVMYFEIPVNDMDRSIQFYQTVFNFEFSKEIIDNNEMALFPFAEENSGITGALAKGEIYIPTKDGVLIYFKTSNIDETLKLATECGGQILYPKTDNGIGFVAEIEDTEGNRIALFQSKE